MEKVFIKIVICDFQGDKSPSAVYVNNVLELRRIGLAGRDMIDLLKKYQNCTLETSEYVLCDYSFPFPYNFSEIPKELIKIR